MADLMEITSLVESICIKRAYYHFSFFWYSLDFFLKGKTLVKLSVCELIGMYGSLRNELVGPFYTIDASDGKWAALVKSKRIKCK